VIEIAQDLGYVVEEGNLIRSDLYLADEIFMTGTAAGSDAGARRRRPRDRRAARSRSMLQKAYLDTVRRQVATAGTHWLDRASRSARGSRRSERGSTELIARRRLAGAGAE
jgi:hypothetical protein